MYRGAQFDYVLGSCHRRCVALIKTKYSELAQLAEHLTVNQVVAGSSPAFGAIKETARTKFVRFLLLLRLLWRKRAHVSDCCDGRSPSPCKGVRAHKRHNNWASHQRPLVPASQPLKSYGQLTSPRYARLVIFPTLLREFRSKRYLIVLNFIPQHSSAGSTQLYLLESQMLSKMSYSVGRRTEKNN